MIKTFFTKLVNDPLYVRNGEKLIVLEKGEIFSEVKFLTDNQEAIIYTNEITEFCETFQNDIWGE